MTIIGHDTAIGIGVIGVVDDADLIDAYAACHHVLGGTPEYQRSRLRAAHRFLTAHPDLTVWMTRPIDDRLADMSGGTSMWPLVTFAMVSTRVQADADFLVVKGFGHSMRRWVAGLYPTETLRLHDAAGRLNISTAQANAFIAEGLAFAIAFTGKTPGELTETDLDRCVTAVRTSTVGTPAMLHSRTGTLFGVRKLLFEAGLVDCPPARRRQGGPATRQARLVVVAAPEIREAAAQLSRCSCCGASPEIDRETHVSARGVRRILDPRVPADRFDQQPGAPTCRSVPRVDINQVVSRKSW
jgi:hypothetical protein